MNLKIIKINMTFFLIIMILCPIIFLGVMKNSIKAIENKDMKYIYLDPGHGGVDGGGISNSGVYEKSINLIICNYLKNYLENSGYNVLLTRNGDFDLASPNSKNRKNEDITKRVEMINDKNTILYISIHCNIYSDERIYGAQTFYNQKSLENKDIAETIQDKFLDILKNTERKAKSIEGKYLIDNVTKPGCLVEVGFLSNKKELELLCNSDYQQKIAYCIYIGIIEFLGI